MEGVAVPCLRRLGAGVEAVFCGLMEEDEEARGGVCG